MNNLSFQFYVGVVGFAWAVYFAGYFSFRQDNTWGIVLFVICGVLCASMAAARLNDVLKELRQLRVWHGEDLRSCQDAATAARRQAEIAAHEDDVTDSGAPKAG